MSSSFFPLKSIEQIFVIAILSIGVAIVSSCNSGDNANSTTTNDTTTTTISAAPETGSDSVNRMVDSTRNKNNDTTTKKP